MFDFLRILVKFFDENKIPYMLSGSVAMSIYTVGRYTKDFDFIIHLNPSNVLRLTEYFKEGYYYDEDSVKEAIHKGGQFNIIDHKSNYKADFFILKNDEFEIIKFGRRLQLDYFDLKVFVISVEDLLLSKLVWIQELQSELQMSDITELSGLNDLDWPYIKSWIKKLKINTFGLINNE